MLLGVTDNLLRLLSGVKRTATEVVRPTKQPIPPDGSAHIWTLGFEASWVAGGVKSIPKDESLVHIEKSKPNSTETRSSCETTQRANLVRRSQIGRMVGKKKRDLVAMRLKQPILMSEHQPCPAEFLKTEGRLCRLRCFERTLREASRRISNCCLV